ncbi:hypothetical protein [Natronobeatus ordinarius]|uniref:hypothetical protein n=1 Tax=Natronobeatus ordinarius TaxID=2963433 RepID=UPI0020CD500E|nr:hypothetical protein [Natronobeatus ordinarius]
MDRRRFLALAAGSGVVAGAGCLDRIPGIGLDTSFELTGTELGVDDPPDVTVDGDTVVVRGTVEYASSECGTVELAHAAYETSQARLDLLVAAVDDSRWPMSCSDDLVETGYRIEATVRGDLRRVTVTEHHVFGDAYSTTADLTDW